MVKTNNRIVTKTEELFEQMLKNECDITVLNELIN